MAPSTSGLHHPAARAPSRRPSPTCGAQVGAVPAGECSPWGRKGREGKSKEGQGTPAGRAGGQWSHGQAEASAERPRRGGAERAGRGSAAGHSGGAGHPSPVSPGRWRSRQPRAGAGGPARAPPALPPGPGASASPWCRDRTGRSASEEVSALGGRQELQVNKFRFCFSPLFFQVIDATSLSWGTRVKGFVACFAIGCLCSILVRSFRQVSPISEFQEHR